MKIEITPQIIALYIGQKCDWVHIETGMFGQREIDALASEHLKSGEFKITPHLRRLESMTEDEAREVYEIAHGIIWTDGNFDEDSCLEYWWQKSAMATLQESTFAIGSPRVWLHLLSKGFDLFGLIDSGLAKDVG